MRRVTRAQILEGPERAAVDRDDEVAGDDQVHLAQERPARARARIDAVHDEENVALVFVELRS